MNFSFDYFKNLNNPEFTLCNPDKRKIAVLDARHAHLTLRFNDLSELTFEVPSQTTNAKAKRIKYTFYSRIETKRLVLIDGVGYFTITEVNEIEDGLDSYKTVTAKSLQARLNDRGFFVEERVYKFFDPYNPCDIGFNGRDVGEMPSVIGQLHEQLGIQIDPRVIQGLAEDTALTYDDWTVSYINPVFRFMEGKKDNVVRSFTESRTIFGYDFIINFASEIFEVIFVFDFLRQAISIKTVEEVTERTNIYLDYDNVVNELTTTEHADEIVTILNCSGSDLDIRSVNPTGTNYIADFSHFLADENDLYPKWMSKELSRKIRRWEKEVEQATPEWKSLVKQLRVLYQTQTELKQEKQFVDLKLFDLRNAIDRFHLAEKGYLLGLTNLERLEEAKAIFTAEEVLMGKRSLDELSVFANVTFDKNAAHTAWRIRPQFEPVESEEFRWTGRFNFLHGNSETDARHNSFNNNWIFPLGSDVHPIEGHFQYFRDNVVGGLGGEENVENYCQLIGEIIAIKMDDDPENIITEYQVTGFRRFTVFSNAPKWEKIYTAESYRLQGKIDTNKAAIEAIVYRMNEISARLNLQKFFDLSSTEERKLLRELRNYWIEADFESSGLAVYYNTPPEEVIDLSLELLEEGRKHLAKMSQPRFKISVDAINFTKIHAFKAITHDLALGRVITIHKADGVHYYPALTSMSWNLDDVHDFSLEFSNALKPNSQDFLFMDLMNENSSTTRKISANWQNLTKFARRENSIDELIHQPLNRTLRLAQGAMNNQQFVIDDTGILGRRFADEGQNSFTPEQIRIINNVMLFTDDAWQTAKTALGRISFTHPTHGEMQAYGLIAESIVGSLIIGNTLYIANDNNTITLDAQGIRIAAANNHNDIRFLADNNGDVFIKGNINALSGSIGGLVVENNTIYSDNGNFSVNADGYLHATSGKIGGFNIGSNTLRAGAGTNAMGISPGATGTAQTVGNYSFWAGSLDPAAAPFSVTRSGAIIATSGTIAGLRMDHEGLSSNTAVFSSALITAPVISAAHGLYGDYIVANNQITVGNVKISGSTLQGIGGSVDLNGGGSVQTVTFTATAVRDGTNNAIRVNVSTMELFTSRIFVVSYRTWIPGSWGGAMGTRTVEVTVQAGHSTGVASAIVGSNVVQDATITNGASFSQTRGGNGVNVTGEFYLGGRQVRTWSDGARTFLIF